MCKAGFFLFLQGGGGKRYILYLDFDCKISLDMIYFVCGILTLS